jgi:valyl-tRNA synthetase
MPAMMKWLARPRVLTDIEKLDARLQNPQFAEKAPANVVAKAKADLAELHRRRASLEDRVKTLEG